jgi:ribosome modulation factor
MATELMVSEAQKANEHLYFKKGYDDFFATRSYNSNPHRRNSFQAKIWSKGWKSAKKDWETTVAEHKGKR